MANAAGAEEGAGHVRGLCFPQGADGSLVEGQRYTATRHAIPERIYQGPSTDHAL